ncbi:MAG TPA: hypothetical protein VEX36_09350 [Thermoleophilaceae bacterium]|nr:hypothetical protein [Thermoleophilaceae bacterium]
MSTKWCPRGVPDDRVAAASVEAISVRVSAGSTVRRGARDQLLDVAPLALGRDREAAVLDERSRVDEVLDVLARCAPTCAWRRSTASGRASSRVSARRSSSSPRSSGASRRSTGFSTDTRASVAGCEPPAKSVTLASRCRGGYADPMESPTKAGGSPAPTPVRDPLANRAAVLAARQRPMSERLELALSWNRVAAELRAGLAGRAKPANRHH